MLVAGPRETLLGYILDLGAWLTILTLLLTAFFKDGLGVHWHDVWSGVLITATAATLLKTALTAIGVVGTAGSIFGATGEALAIATAFACALMIVYYGIIFTHVRLVRRGMQAPAQ